MKAQEEEVKTTQTQGEGEETVAAEPVKEEPKTEPEPNPEKDEFADKEFERQRADYFGERESDQTAGSGEQKKDSPKADGDRKTEPEADGAVEKKEPEAEKEPPPAVAGEKKPAEQDQLTDREKFLLNTLHQQGLTFDQNGNVVPIQGREKPAADPNLDALGIPKDAPGKAFWGMDMPAMEMPKEVAEVMEGLVGKENLPAFNQAVQLTVRQYISPFMALTRQAILQLADQTKHLPQVYNAIGNQQAMESMMSALMDGAEDDQGKIEAFPNVIQLISSPDFRKFMRERKKVLNHNPRETRKLLSEFEQYQKTAAAKAEAARKDAEAKAAADRITKQAAGAMGTTGDGKPPKGKTKDNEYADDFFSKQLEQHFSRQ